ncbi:MAG TPA: hypothetical protein VGC04_04550 [Cellulomonas sp.]
MSSPEALELNSLKTAIIPRMALPAAVSSIGSVTEMSLTPSLARATPRMASSHWFLAARLNL